MTEGFATVAGKSIGNDPCKIIKLSIEIVARTD
jgi:hypothetical protein